MRIILLALMGTALWACWNKAPKTDGHAAVLEGEITNANEDVVLLTYLRGVNSQTDTIQFKDHRQFRAKIPLEDPKYILFRHGNEYQVLFLCPGDSVRMTLNTDDFDESMKFSGIGATANNYLISSFLFSEQKGYDHDGIYQLEPPQFIAQVDTIRQIKEQFLEHYISQNSDLDKHFIESEKARIQYQWANQRLSYPKAYAYYTGEQPSLPENYDRYLEELKLDNPEMINLIAYARFLSQYVDKLASEQFEMYSLSKDENKWALVKFDVVAGHFENEAVKDYLYFRTIKDRIKYYGINNIDSLLTIFHDRVNNQDYLAKVEDLKQKWTALAQGEPAPDFAFPNVKGDTFSLSDFRGKFVYIDVWATWCTPCKKELPHMKRLMKKYDDRDIVFLGISIDGQKENWEEMVRDKDIQGIQLYAGGPRTSITEDYMIHGIPRFILIDKSGNIHDAQAPRPSTEEIEHALAALGL